MSSIWSFVAAHPFISAAISIPSYLIIGYVVARLSWWTWWSPRSKGTPLRPLLFPYTWSGAANGPPPFESYYRKCVGLRLAAWPCLRKHRDAYVARITILWPLKFSLNAIGWIISIFVAAFRMIRSFTRLLDRMFGTPNFPEEEPTKAESAEVAATRRCPRRSAPHPIVELSGLESQIARLEAVLAESTAMRDGLVAQREALLKDPDKGKIIALHAGRPVA